MLVLFKGVCDENVLIFDAEYNEGRIIQFSGVIFRKIEEDVFQISKSLNIYIKLDDGRINSFIERYTGITNSFLETFGVSRLEAISQIEDFLKVDGKLLVVSHGLKNDRQIMLDNGINLYRDEKNKKLNGFCTYKASKEILKRNKDLSLEAVASDAGIFLSNGHNAFDDAWATIGVFSLLRKLKMEEKNEKIL